MAIGDNYNDLEMLEFAGNPVVMANGAPDLVEMAQEPAGKLAATNDQDGVALAIESVLAGASLEGMVE